MDVYVTIAQTDLVTLCVWAGFLPVWLGWEVYLLRKRGQRITVRTLSQVARDRAWQLTAVVFFWTAMPVHWWIPIGWGTTAGGVAFWALQAALLVWNVATWRRTSQPLAWWPAWLRWVNWPVWYLLAGPAAAAILFPQNGAVPWRP